MGQQHTIGQLAREVGVPVSTVRYYERVGLLAPQGRTEANYRFYDEETLERLRFIRAAKDAGFALEDVATLLELRDGSLAPCSEVQTLIENRLYAIGERIDDFRRVQRELEACLEICRAERDPAHCQVLDRIADEAALTPGPPSSGSGG